MKDIYFSYFKGRFFITILFFLLGVFLHAQEETIIISGLVKDRVSQNPLENVEISVKGHPSIFVKTDLTGTFVLKNKIKLPFVLIFKGEQIETKEIEVLNTENKISVELNIQSILVEEVVISASKVAEKISRSPVSIEKLDIKAIKETPSPSFYDALANVKGVQLTTSSLTFKVPNSRGFNIPNNFRFMQLVDGVDIQAATLGVPLGNAIGPTELDIESVEITPGTASALYGMNAINGLASLQTKSPFSYSGLSVYQKSGVNHINNNIKNPSLLSETGLRYAKVFGDKFAFKMNASYLKGTDWVSNSLNEQNANNLSSANSLFPALNGSNNPASDLWNNYGDESNNRTTVKVTYQGKQQSFNISRTGYLEKDLTPTDVRNIKTDVALYYKIKPELELSYTYRFGLLDGIFQRGNKIRLDGAIVQNHKVELKGKTFLIRAYTSIENTGNSYNLKPLADNLDLNNGSNAAWAKKFQTKLQSQLDNKVDFAQAFKDARSYADEGRVKVGTSDFEQLKKTIIGINNWDIAANVTGAPASGGAQLKQNSNLYHFDGQWDLNDYIQWAHILVGCDYRLYEVVPDGNNFVDFSRPLSQRNVILSDGTFGKNQYYQKYGAFVQLTKKFFDDKLKVNASLRVDQNPEFSPKVNPRIAFVYTLASKQYLRASIQNGWRFPSLFEALSFVNNGQVRRVGGLSRVNDGVGYLDNSYTLNSINDFNAAVNKDVAAGKTTNQAAIDNKGKLVVANLAIMQPENINSIEVGYRGNFLENKLNFDWDAYYNITTGFLGQVEVAVPKNAKVGDDVAVIGMISANRAASQDRYRVFTNADKVYVTYGSTLGVTYNFYEKYVFSTNINFNNIIDPGSDKFITAFNTPKWTANLTIGNREVVKNLGFNLVARWQDFFEWQSPLANGTIDAFYTIDAQVNYKIHSLKTIFKLGASNLLNRQYIQYAAGPTIGALYYLTIVFDQNLLK